MTKNVSLKLTKNVRSDQKRQSYSAHALLKNAAFGKVLARRLLEERQAERQSKKTSGQIHYGFDNFLADAEKHFIFT